MLARILFLDGDCFLVDENSLKKGISDSDNLAGKRFAVCARNEDTLGAVRDALAHVIGQDGFLNLPKLTMSLLLLRWKHIIKKQLIKAHLEL